MGGSGAAPDTDGDKGVHGGLGLKYKGSKMCVVQAKARGSGVSVVDPYWFQCRSGNGFSILVQPGFGSRVLMTKN
jgi:hypothetical protein